MRYPGGKAILANQIKSIISFNDIVGIDYAEPFAGGAGLALRLLIDEYVSHIYLNDLDSAIFAFWSSVLEQTSELCKLIIDTPITIEKWHYCKEVLANPLRHTLLEFGFATFFLNRTNRSGIITGGVIGGLLQDGNYKIDCRFNKTDLIGRIELIASHKKDISLTRFDACDFIKNVINQNPVECLTFLDPPYYEKGNKLYLNHFIDKDHLKISKIIKNKLKTPWIVTYGDVPEINSMYSMFPKIRYQINYTASKKQKGNEIMYYSTDLKIPSDKIA
jgi:DNA adenine methylase